MCVDVSKNAIHSLVTLILQHESVLLQPDLFSVHRNPSVPSSKDESGDNGGMGLQMLDIERAVVLSAVNILTNQIFQLLRGTTPAQVSQCFQQVVLVFRFFVSVFNGMTQLSIPTTLNLKCPDRSGSFTQLSSCSLRSSIVRQPTKK